MEITSKTLKELDKGKEEEDMQKVEAVLFISGRFLSMQELISYTDLNPIVIREAIEKLKKQYDKIGSSIEIIEKFEKGEDSNKVAGNELWKMNVRQEYSYLINKLATGSSEFSKSEQETLAIIAYKQPIKQSVVVKIRGNKSYDHVKKFAELGLLKKKKIGHTYELSLSNDFYDYFSVN